MTTEEISNIADCIEELEKKVAQLKIENSISSTTSSQREVNEYLLERCNHSILLLNKKKRYLLLSLEKPQNERHHLYDAITTPSSIRGYSPNWFLDK